MEPDPMFHSWTPTSAVARLLGPEPINTHPTNTERDPQFQVPWTECGDEYLESQHFGEKDRKTTASQGSAWATQGVPS